MNQREYRFSQRRRQALYKAAYKMQESKPEAAAGLMRKIKDAEYQSAVRKARRVNHA